MPGTSAPKVILVFDGIDSRKYTVQVCNGCGPTVTARLPEAEFWSLLALTDAHLSGRMIDLLPVCGSRVAVFTTVYRTRMALSFPNDRLGWRVIANRIGTIYELVNCQVTKTPNFDRLLGVIEEPMLKRVQERLPYNLE